MGRHYVFADAHAAGVPREQRQVYVLVEELPMQRRLVVHRLDDDPGRVANIPVEWLEELSPPDPPVPAEPEGEFFVIEKGNLPNGGSRFVPRLMAHKTGFGWAVGGGNKDGALLPWKKFCERHGIGSPGVTIRRLVPEEAHDAR